MILATLAQAAESSGMTSSASTVNDGPVMLDAWDMAWISACLLLNVLLSLILQLGMTRSLLIAGTRTVVQLLAVGYVLQQVFAADRPLFVLALLLGMGLLAGQAVNSRTRHRYPGQFRIAAGSLMFPAFLMTSYAVLVVVQPEDPFDPAYLIPLMGMVFGNSLTAVSLAIDRFVSSMVEQRNEVEVMLGFGASRAEAVRPFVRDAVRTGMMPMINAMTVVGIVSLPGMMTGQILGGTAPELAVRYQILIMFLLAGSTAMGAGLAVLWLRRHLLDPQDRLRSGIRARDN
jgi:putative ABC transport system permease protein